MLGPFNLSLTPSPEGEGVAQAAGASTLPSYTSLHISLVDMCIALMTGSREGRWVLCTLCWTSRSLGLHAAWLVPQPHLATEPIHTFDSAWHQHPTVDLAAWHQTASRWASWNLLEEPQAELMLGGLLHIAISKCSSTALTR